MSSPVMVYALNESEDGEVFFRAFKSRAEALAWIEPDDSTKFIPPEDYKPGYSTGWLVIEGRPLKIQPKTVVTEWGISD